MTLGSLAVTGNSMKREGAGTPLYHATPAPYDDYFDGETADFMWLDKVWSDSGSGLDHPGGRHRRDRPGRGWAQGRPRCLAA